MSFPCSTKDCPKRAHAKGLCDVCYKKFFGYSYKPERKNIVSRFRRNRRILVKGEIKE